MERVAVPVDEVKRVGSVAPTPPRKTRKNQILKKLTFPETVKIRFERGYG